MTAGRRADEATAGARAGPRTHAMSGKQRRRTARTERPGPTAISAIRIYALDIPLREDFAISGSRAGTANNVLVGITTRDGRTGWGEASPVRRVTGETQATCLAAAAEIKRSLCGRDAREPARCVAVMEGAVAGQPTIRSAFDIALFDLAAQRAGLPLWKFLGGRRKGPLPTDATIFLRPVRSVAERARELVAAGFGRIKIKLGDPARDDVLRVKLVRQAVGPGIELRVDANQGWDRAYALKTLRAIAAYDVVFCEQPLPAADPEGLREVARLSPIPVMADESLFTPRDAAWLAAGPLVPLFNIKLSKSGGLLGARAIAAVAHGAGIACMTGCMNESRLGLTAAAHFAAAMEAVKFYDLDSHLMHAADWMAGGLKITGGRVILPAASGLGARPRAAWLGKQKPVL